MNTPVMKASADFGVSNILPSGEFRPLWMKMSGYVEDLVKRNDYTPITQLFYGLSYTQLSRNKDSRASEDILSVRPELFFPLHLPIVSPDITDGFMKTMDEEHLTGENRWYNETTKTFENVFKRTQYWRLPHVWVVVLDRFNPVNPMMKCNECVRFPLQFHVQKECSESSEDEEREEDEEEEDEEEEEEDEEEEDQDEDDEAHGKSRLLTYELYGVCNHTGNAMGGHYTSIVRHCESEIWLECDDVGIRRLGKIGLSITEEDLQNRLWSSDSYCLFYSLVSR
jgi:ubiquitin C-terminal hydrolase